MKVLFWIGTIWLIGWLGYILSGALSWSNSLEGAAANAMQGVFFSPFMLILTLPLGLVGWGIGSLRRLRRWRLGISLLLPTVLVLGGVVPAIQDRLDPGRRITRLTGVTFPRSAKIVNLEYSGGGFADLTYVYEFTCPAEETDRLIYQMKLKLEEGASGSWGWAPGSAPIISGGWRVEEVWRYSKEPEAMVSGGADFITLRTDASRTKVHLTCSTI